MGSTRARCPLWLTPPSSRPPCSLFALLITPAPVRCGRLLIQEAPELPPVLARNLVAEGGQDTRLTWADFVAFDEVRGRGGSFSPLIPVRIALGGGSQSGRVFQPGSNTVAPPGTYACCGPCS